jgi:hypothetical protein
MGTGEMARWVIFKQRGHEKGDRPEKRKKKKKLTYSINKEE